MIPLARLIYTQRYANELEEYKFVSYRASFDAALLGSLYGPSSGILIGPEDDITILSYGIPTGAGGDAVYGAFTSSYFKFDVWDEIYDGLFIAGDSAYPAAGQGTQTNLDPNGYFGGVTCVLEIEKDDYLVSGFGGFGRVTNGVIAWVKSGFAGIIAESPCLIATDGTSALFVFADQSGSYPGPYEARFHYITVPLSSSAGTVEITELPYFSVEVESPGDNRYCLSVLGENMPNFTIAVTNDSGQSSDGRNGSGCGYYIGPAVAQAGGGHNFNSFGFGTVSFDPEPVYGIGTYTEFEKAIGGVIDLASSTAIFSPIVPESSIQAFLPESLSGGYEKSSFPRLSWGFSYAALPPTVFWTNLRLTATG